MKQLNITIHPFSALAGMALLGLVWVTVGAMPLQGSSSTRDVSAIENVNEAHPRDAVRVMQGTAYTVPSGRLLVVTGMGGSVRSGAYVDCYINGSIALTVLASAYDGMFTELPLGLTALAGDVVTLASNLGGSPAVLLGYLVDA